MKRTGQHETSPGPASVTAVHDELLPFEHQGSRCTYSTPQLAEERPRLEDPTGAVFGDRGVFARWAGLDRREKLPPHQTGRRRYFCEMDHGVRWIPTSVAFIGLWKYRTLLGKAITECEVVRNVWRMNISARNSSSYICLLLQVRP